MRGYRWRAASSHQGKRVIIKQNSRGFHRSGDAPHRSGGGQPRKENTGETQGKTLLNRHAGHSSRRAHHPDWRLNTTRTRFAMVCRYASPTLASKASSKRTLRVRIALTRNSPLRNLRRGLGRILLLLGILLLLRILLLLILVLGILRFRFFLATSRSRHYSQHCQHNQGS
jgi:hypothetical protein